MKGASILDGVLFFLVAPVASIGCDSAINEADTDTEGGFVLEGWADYWFAVYLEDILLLEGRVPITTGIE